MDVAEVNERVERIRQVAADYESAHGKEDRLLYDVLHTIAEGRASDPAALAAAAVEAEKIDFPRYTA